MLASLFGMGLLLAAQAGGGNATIERLRSAGANSIVVEACAIVGYKADSDAIDAYVEQQFRQAYTDGMPIATAQTHMDAGMQSRGAAIKAELAKSADADARKLVADLVTDCAALASGADTRAMFESTPADAAAARAAGYKRLGLEAP